MNDETTAHVNGDTTMTDTGSPMKPRYDSQNRRLCDAHRVNGGRCRAPAMSGQAVCRSHGGSSPQARDGARRRLAALVDPSLETLADELANGETSAIRIRAATTILDRAGIVGPESIDEQGARDLLLARLLELRAERLEVADEVELRELEP